jgi:hypothetical protein
MGSRGTLRRRPTESEFAGGKVGRVEIGLCWNAELRRVLEASREWQYRMICQKMQRAEQTRDAKSVARLVSCRVSRAVERESLRGAQPMVGYEKLAMPYAYGESAESIYHDVYIGSPRFVPLLIHFFSFLYFSFTDSSLHPHCGRLVAATVNSITKKRFIVRRFQRERPGSLVGRRVF